MPRERIIDGPLWTHYPEGYKEPDGDPTPSARIYRPGDETPKGALIYQDPSADLVWRREFQPGMGDGFVQLTVEAPVEWVRKRLAETEDLGDGHYVQVPLEVMDRRQVNQMIRHLKRARDAAYGADE